MKKMKVKPTLDQVKRIFKKYKGWEAYATCICGRVYSAFEVFKASQEGFYFALSKRYGMILPPPSISALNEPFG